MDANQNKAKMQVFIGFFGLALCGIAAKNLVFSSKTAGATGVEQTNWFNSALIALGVTCIIVALWLRSKQN